MPTTLGAAHRQRMNSNTIDTTVQAHLDAVGRLYGAYGNGDIEAVLAELDDDVDWAAEAATGNVPWYGPHHGKHDVPRFFEAIGSNVDVTEFDLIGMSANDTDVVATIHWTYTVKSTGRKASMYMQHWWRFADGKIVFFRGSEDSAQSAAAFGQA
jgi:ketosteroid isomerase-like protein